MAPDADERDDAAANEPQPLRLLQPAQPSSAPPQELHRVAVKVPPFWKARPELWFSQIESQFYTANITVDATKYHTVVAAIESSILSEVSDIILAPPPVRMYDTLKKRLIDTFADSEERRIGKLLQEMELGERKPSQLLHHMRGLAGTQIADDVLKALWMQHLPVPTRSILSVSNDGLSHLAALADKIAEASSTPGVAAMSLESQQTQVGSLNIQVSKLSQQIDELKAYLRQNERSREHKPRARSQSRSEEHCWYHRRFGPKARKCLPPCTFSGARKPEN